MTSGPFPELLVSRQDRPGSATWKVEAGTARRGDAWTELCARRMRVPLGPGSHERVVRLHELMHARVSPSTPGPFEGLGLPVRTVECAEEFRVNHLLDRLGFDLSALRDGSERLTGRRLAEVRDLAELARFAVATAGTPALADLCAGVRGIDGALARSLRSLERRLLRAARRIPTAALASTRADEEGRPEGFSVHTRALAALVERHLTTPSSATVPRGGPRPAATGRFAELVVDREVVLDRRLCGSVAARLRPATTGRRVAHPGRLLTDPSRRVFEAPRASGGVVVVDQSGSMALRPEDLDALVAAAPGAFVLGYSHRPGASGVPNAWVLADRGRVASTVRAGNVGNGVDGPALRFALARRRPREPVVWLCDGQVTDSGDHADPALARECALLVLRHRVHMAASVEEALGALRAPGAATRASRLLGRVGAAVTPDP